MTTPIGNALQEIHLSIPRQILSYVFGKEEFNNWRRPAPVSVDEMILSKVIRRRVLKDANLIGGKSAWVSLEGLSGSQTDLYTRVYQVPPERVGRREIMSVLEVSYLSFGMGIGSVGAPYSTGALTGQSDLTTVSQRVQDSFSSIAHVSSADVELIGYNTVMLRDSLQQSQAAMLRCLLSNEENLSNLQPRSYRHFATACKLAVKSYIYNETFITLGQGMMEQGQALGQFKEAIDEYKDAEEMYQTFLTETLMKVLFINDHGSHERFIRMQINPSL